MTWNNYEIEPKYSNEYWEFITALKQLATAEHISIESVVYNGRDKKMELSIFVQSLNPQN